MRSGLAEHQHIATPTSRADARRHAARRQALCHRAPFRRAGRPECGSLQTGGPGAHRGPIGSARCRRRHASGTLPFRDGGAFSGWRAGRRDSGGFPAGVVRAPVPLGGLMLPFLARRLAESVVVLVLVSSVSFALILFTDDPVAMMLPTRASESDRLALQRQLGLDRPIVEQYVSFVGRA